MSQLRIGISGWQYPPWRKVFYPPGLVHRRELEYVASRMNSVEINGTFYSLKRPGNFQQWREQTPPGFLFAIKGGRFISHMKKLRDCRIPLANFLAQGLLLLENKLGPILWQFPQMLRFDPRRLEEFFAILPRDTAAAAKLAADHDAKLAGRAHTTASSIEPLRYAIEIRHPSFLCHEAIDLFRSHGVALALADTAGIWPYTEDITADFVYIRLHGAEQLYWSGYTPEMLDWWARRIEAWRSGREPVDARRVAGPAPAARQRDIYVYFDNDAQVRAPFDAIALAKRLGVNGAGLL